MKIQQYNDHIEISGLNCFCIDKIFDCGQCFRFDPDPTGGISGVALGQRIRFLQKSEDSVSIYTKLDGDTLIRYLSLDRDYDLMNTDIAERFGRDKTITEAINAGKGIRILRQDPFETLISFIISQNNNIPRIKKLIDALCRECGDRIGESDYAFPTPEAICDLGVDKLREMKTGFRAAYIYDAARRVAVGETDLRKIAALDTESACAELMKIKGVGLKVASCVLLFGFDKLDTFPVDVWIKRVIDKYYPNGLEIDALGENRGLAQQYLFYYERYKNA